MPNDDELKEFLNEQTLECFLGEGAASVRAWLSELLDTRTEMRIIRRAMMRYVDRNIELTEAARDAKSNLEYWVTQAGMWEAKARGNKGKRDG